MIPSKHQFVGKKVKLGELCEIYSGGTPKRSVSEYWTGGNVPWVKIGDITEKYVSSTEECITQAGLNNSSAKLFKPGTLLYSIFASIGAVGILNILAATNQAIAGLVIRDNSLDHDFLYHYLKSREVASKTSGRGAAQSNINLTILRNMQVPVPPLVVQKEIVQNLEIVSRQLKMAKLQLSKLDSLVKSRFVEMFGDFKTNVKCWPVANFDSFAFIDTHMTKDFDKYADEPHIGIDSIEAKTGRLVGYRTVAEDKLVSGKYPFTAKHIIYSKIRPNLNKVALPDFSGLCSADAYPIMPIEGKSNRVFLAHVMRSNYFLDYILPLSGRAQMPKVNKDAIRGFSMPLPPIDLQNTFAAFAAQVDKSRFAGTFTGTINVKNYAISCSVHNNSGRIPNEALHSAREVTECALFELQELYDSLTQKYFAL